MAQNCKKIWWKHTNVLWSKKAWNLITILTVCKIALIWSRSTIILFKLQAEYIHVEDYAGDLVNVKTRKCTNCRRLIKYSSYVFRCWHQLEACKWKVVWSCIHIIDCIYVNHEVIYTEAKLGR